MQKKHLVPFTITGMDALGQGVSKVGDKVTFIPKSIPGDQGEAELLSERKGVAFAKISHLTTASPERKTPECIHFDTCPSCHYLHTSYEQELVFKKESFLRLFRKMQIPQLTVIPATRRIEYRNRIQLHYSLKSKLLGMKVLHGQDILPIPQCRITIPAVTNELQRLYHNQQWLKEAPKELVEGHVEIYWVKNTLKTTWNRPYAEGGFTQVFEEMNQVLKDTLKNEWHLPNSTELLDLFAGNGNLSERLNYSKRLCVDIYEGKTSEHFFSHNLYASKAFERVNSELKQRNMKIQTLLLDPPRSGFKNLSDWLKAIRPQTVAYVSCDPHTLVRDLEGIKDYQIQKAFLIDFFPSTFHFESLIILERKC